MTWPTGDGTALSARGIRSHREAVLTRSHGSVAPLAAPVALAS